MNQNWEHHLAAWHLAEAGRWDEALRTTAPFSDLHALLSQRAFRPVTTGDPVIIGWQFYYQGLYKEALAHFLSGSACDDDPGSCGWRLAWARLGVAKVASDAGHWKSGLAWCSSAWVCAAREEHLDLMAQIAGARGEILLRAGKPSEAAAAFAEDRALLPPGSRYHGRARSYQAHAWARLGARGRSAAALAYRLALHSPGESATGGYAAAGLALLAAREGLKDWDENEGDAAGDGLPRFWVLVVKARLSPSALGLDLACRALPSIHFAEHWWLANWRRSLGFHASPPPELHEAFPENIPLPPEHSYTLVEKPFAPDEIPDAPWWSSKLPESPEEWWRLRDCFMP